MKTWIGRAAVVVATLVLASCASDGDVDDGAHQGGSQETPDVEHRVAVDSGAVGPPGTEIAPEVDVVDGSSLIGPTFPLLGWTDAGEHVVAGWQAVVVIDADPVEVWDGYVRQLGIDDRATAGEACTVSRRGSPRQVAPVTDTVAASEGQDRSDSTRFLTEPVIDGEDRIECQARFDQTELIMIVGQDGCGLWQGTEIPPECREHEIAHLLIRMQTDPFVSNVSGFRSLDRSLGTDELRYARGTRAPNEIGGPDSYVPIPSGAVMVPRFGAPQPSRLPAGGERIDDGLDYFLDDNEDPDGGLAIVPEEGASLVAPAMLQFCNSGLVAVLSVSAQPEQAVQSFAVAGDDETLTVERDADPAWAQLSASQAGGYYLDLLAVAQPDGPSAVLVTECGD